MTTMPLFRLCPKYDCTAREKREAVAAIRNVTRTHTPIDFPTEGEALQAHTFVVAKHPGARVIVARFYPTAFPFYASSSNKQSAK